MIAVCAISEVIVLSINQNNNSQGEIYGTVVVREREKQVHK